MWLKKIFQFILLFWVALATAQPPSKFYCRYGGNGYDVGYDVKQTLDNGYIITGSTSSFGQGNTDMYLMKLDSVGQIVFQKSFGGVSNEVGKSIVQLLDSSYVMVGYTSSNGVGGYDMYLVKTDKNGNLLWQKTIGGSDWDFAYSLQATTDGGFIIAGSTYSFGNGKLDGYVVKTDLNGDTTWTKTFGGINDDEFKSVIQTADGSYALTGYTKSYNDLDSGDVWVLKLNPVGDTLWRKFYGGTNEDFGNQIIEHPTGDLFIAGGSGSFGVSKMNGYAIHLNNNGNYIFHQLDNTSSSIAIFTSVAISSRNPNIIGFIAKETKPGFDFQFKLIELNFSLYYFNGSDSGSNIADETFKIIATKDSGYAIVGYTYGFGAINTDVYFVKVDSTLTAGSNSIISVKEISQDDIKYNVFPNPVAYEINLKSSIEIQIDQLKLYDITGKEVLINNIKTKNSNKEMILNVENLNDGIYFLKYLNRTEKISIIH